MSVNRIYLKKGLTRQPRLIGPCISITLAVLLQSDNYGFSMPLAEDKIVNRYSISAYNPGEIIVNQTTYRDSLILSPQSIHSPWPVLSVDELDESNLQPILDMNPRVVLLGTGEHQIFPDTRIFALFGQTGIGLEVMDNGALCRTFNILVAEDREVVAAIIQ